ncbi:metal-binding protein [Persephonella sp.]
MAAGRTHDIINLSILPVAVYYLDPVNFEGFISGYLIGTFFLSPDNDIYNSKPNKRWGILKFIWYPFGKIFSHRGISHIPIIGTAVKIIYLTFIFLTLMFLVISLLRLFNLNLSVNIYEIINKPFIDYLLESGFLPSFLIGIVLSEIIHILTDYMFSSLKRFKIIGK